jgi:hypothetical protein
MDNSDKVKLTWDLLDKKYHTPDLLTENEKKVLAEYEQDCLKRDKELEEENKKLREECKYLTSGFEHTLIPAFGWIQPIKKMAYELEALNIIFKKFHYTITFDQTKEKFGTFRGYYSITRDSSTLYKFLTWPLHSLNMLLSNKINYRETTNIKSPYEVERYIECNSDDDLEFTKEGEEIVEIAGKKYKKERCTHPVKTIIVPTKFKLLWKIKNLVNKLDTNFSNLISFVDKDSIEYTVIREALDDKVSDIVNKCEHECDNHCIECGCWIGKNSKRFQTRGWITYVCPKCAKLHKNSFDCTTSAIMHSQLMFEARLKKAILECELSNAISSNSVETIKEAVNRLGSKKAIDSGIRKLEITEFDNCEDDNEDGCECS